jgi:hypothetical protein
MLLFVDDHPTDAHLRSLLEGHLTASALVVERDSGRVLLALHRKLDLWLQLGGHCDGDANLIGVAWREAREESGIEELCICPAVCDVDIHAIPARPGEPAHLHYDTRFLVLAPRGARPRLSGESHELRWLEPAQARQLAGDDSLRRLLETCASILREQTADEVLDKAR